MTHKTKGIVLRSIKYGETSLVVTIFTELFGAQTYMVNGARTAKKGNAKASLYQPSSILDLEVYHNELKGMQRIKEANRAIIYQDNLSDVLKNSIALYMVELLQKTLKQPEANADLFYFCEDALVQLDQSGSAVAANFPLFFSLHLAQFFGFRLSNIESAMHDSEQIYIDLAEGYFTTSHPGHPYFLEGENALLTMELLNIMQPEELSQLKLNQQKRRELLAKYQEFYVLHIPDFGQMKTLPILHEVLG
ncbi:MAG: recO [Ferruginibacter sp.]|nr:recO [Ferruginibacter sp.]